MEASSVLEGVHRRGPRSPPCRCSGYYHVTERRLSPSCGHSRASRGLIGIWLVTVVQRAQFQKLGHEFCLLSAFLAALSCPPSPTLLHDYPPFPTSLSGISGTMTPPLPFSVRQLPLVSFRCVFLCGRSSSSLLLFASPPLGRFSYSRAQQILFHKGNYRVPPPRVFAPLVSPRPPALPSGLPLPQSPSWWCSSSPTDCCSPPPRSSPQSDALVDRMPAVNILWSYAVRFN